MAHPGIAAFFVAALVLTAPSAAQNRIPVVSDVKELTTGIEHFSYTLLLQTARSFPDSNVVVSPFSVWAMIAVLSEGANGLTKDEILHTLDYPTNPSPPRKSFKVGTVFSNIAPYFLVNTSTVQLETINSIFYHSGSSINRDFENIVKSVYKTSMIPLDFSQSDSARKVNNFISIATHNRINEIVSRNDLKNAQMILTNAIFFKGQWTLPFNVSDTQYGAPFYNDQNIQIGKVNMMYERAAVPYVNMKNFSSHVVELPYGQATCYNYVDDDKTCPQGSAHKPGQEEKRLSMVIILPHRNVPLDEVIVKFTRVPVANIFTQLKEAAEQFEDDEIDVYIPRFSVTSDIILNKALMDMGTRDVFNPEFADLSLLSSTDKLHLSRVIHKAQIEVTEEGTVASAVTAGELSNRNTPPKFMANRPFLFLIIEKSTNVVVFGGTYVKPSQF